MDIVTTHPVATAAATLVAAGALYYLFGGGLGKTSRAHCSVVVGPATENSSPIYQNFRIGPNDQLETKTFGQATLYECTQYAFKNFHDQRCLGTRPHVKDHKEEKTIRGETKVWITPEMGSYSYLTYAEVSDKIDAIGAGLVALGLKPSDNMALFMETRADWTLTAQSAFSQNIVVMTVYANLGEEALIYGLNQAEARVMVTTGDLIGMIAKHHKKLDYLKTVVYADAEKTRAADLNTLKEAGIQLLTFAELEVLGKKNPVPHNPPKPGDLAVLMYTSGSTGMPKGVMCSHSNCVAAISGVLKAIQLHKGDVHLSYLPLAHILAFVVECGCLVSGATICYGNPRTLSDIAVKNCRGDIPEARPNFLVGVPTVYDKIKAGILTKVNAGPAWKKSLFDTAFEQKKAAMAEGKDTPLWNKLVFNTMTSALGGRVRFMVSGGAPLSKECGEFMRTCFGVPVLQGYALTETCAGGTLGELDDLSAITNVGPPIAAVQIKLVDCPEMGYTHKDPEGPRGEIWIRGGSVTSGYYKNPEKTAEEFIGGWFKTGDIGRLNPNGTFSIIDRIKNLVKPPHGEYIAVERLESTYKNSPLVASIMVFACSEKNELVALIHPNKPNLEKWAHSQGIELHFDELCADPRANKAVLDSLNTTWKETNLKSIERVSAIHLYPDEWTPANGWLTAAMKIQRPTVQKTQADVIQKLYAGLGY